MNNFSLYEAIDEKLRDAIANAEESYDSPYIVIVANPEIVDALKTNMDPSVGTNMTNVKIDGYEIFESEDVVLGVFVCGENLDSEKKRIQQRLRNKMNI